MVDMERVALNLVKIIEEIFERESSGFDLENRD
jgi:hypothetical protein